MKKLQPRRYTYTFIVFYFILFYFIVFYFKPSIKSTFLPLNVQKIAVLEEKYSFLQNQMKVGIRNVDDVEKEMKDCKNEILILRRKYLNNFYYF
jgi:hypothetical protein